ncbi:ABC transporter substrate-binding protein [Rodentibacter myodis]|uniref:Peptide ABC transporter substrate-binding protein n=1 Tax=Rodentibacter myodis TaxID=1907939 RepID=A0A1V3JRG3_9PAST|nr:ABC transporter substrate-binding protein [Rodentibacter myodis]OOF59204.1 peptide ABC transporter substrate-binding protein [Rodentibacter myodis]
MLHRILKIGFIALSLNLCLGLSVDAKIVQDTKGNQIEIPDQITRLADLWHANNQIVLLLGGADKLVATTNVIQKNPWFSEVYPNIKNVPALTNGQTIQIEELLQRNPQVVLLSNAKMAEELQQAGMKVVLVDFQDFEGLKKNIKITADVLGGSALLIAQKYIQELESNIAFVKSRTSALKEENKPSVLHISSGNNVLKIDGGNSIIGDWIRKAGGRNVFLKQKNLVEIGMEDVLNADPDIIIVGSTDAKAGVDKILQDPNWQSISAVKNKRVFVNPTGTFPWDRYSAEEALQVLWAVKLFHPNLFKDIDMVEKTQNFYKKYYHYDLSLKNAEQILNGLPPLK